MSVILLLQKPMQRMLGPTDSNHFWFWSQNDASPPPFPFRKVYRRSPWTTDTKSDFFFKNPKLLDLGRQIEPKMLAAFGIF